MKEITSQRVLLHIHFTKWRKIIIFSFFPTFLKYQRHFFLLLFFHGWYQVNFPQLCLEYASSALYLLFFLFLFLFLLIQKKTVCILLQEWHPALGNNNRTHCRQEDYQVACTIQLSEHCFCKHHLKHAQSLKEKISNNSSCQNTQSL